jgi:hypothetical protein
MSLSLQQKIEMLELNYLQHNKSATTARAAYCTAKGLRTEPSVSAFKQVYATFRETDSINRERSKRPRTVRTGRIIENVRVLNEDLTSACQSLRVRPGACEVRISKSSYHRIIRDNLKIYPYIPRLKHHLTKDDHGRNLHANTVITWEAGTAHELKNCPQVSRQGHLT